jgi:glycosyltransferase involved in cell wall biosynthesis
MAEPGGAASILLVCDFNAHGGTQTHVLDLLARLDRARFRPSLAALTLNPDLAARLSRLDVEVIDLRLRGVARPATWWAVLRLMRHARRRRIALVHGFLFQGNALASLIARAGRVPCLTSVRNMDAWKKPWHRRVSAWAHRGARRVVFNSTRVRDHTMAREGIPSGRAVVIPNGVADPLSAPALPPGGPDVPAHAGGPVAVCVASLRPKKGHIDLLDAFARVAAQVPGAALWLAGEGPLRGELEREVSSRGLGAAVRFLGYRPDAIAVMRRADVFVLPSREEGMPNALLEAMGAGLPAVATDVGGTGEALADGKTGFLVAPGRPEEMAARLTALLADAPLRERFGRAARARFEARFTVQRMMDDYHRLYAQVLAAAGAAR